MSFARDWDWLVFYNMPLPHTGAHACRHTHASDYTRGNRGDAHHRDSVLW